MSEPSKRSSMPRCSTSRPNGTTRERADARRSRPPQATRPRAPQRRALLAMRASARCGRRSSRYRERAGRSGDRRGSARGRVEFTDGSRAYSSMTGESWSWPASNPRDRGHACALGRARFGHHTESGRRFRVLCGDVEVRVLGTGFDVERTASERACGRARPRRGELARRRARSSPQAKRVGPEARAQSADRAVERRMECGGSEVSQAEGAEPRASASARERRTELAPARRAGRFQPRLRPARARACARRRRRRRAAARGRCRAPLGPRDRRRFRICSRSSRATTAILARRLRRSRSAAC